MLGIWGQKRGLRCAEIVLTLFVKGHRADAEQACIYQCMSMMRRMLTRRPELQERFGKVWAKRYEKASAAGGPALRPEMQGTFAKVWGRVSTVGGPVGCILDAAVRLGWEWPSPFEFVLHGGARVDVLNMEQSLPY